MNMNKDLGFATPTQAFCMQDQLRQEQERGRIFQHLKEGKIIFHPTYKFDRANRDPFAYDSSEKLRVPAYTDRIFFRGSVSDSMQEVCCFLPVCCV